jgi:hypothetical protein
MNQRTGFGLVALLLSFLAAGCGDSEDPGDNRPNVPEGACADETRGETYSAGMTFEGEKGLTVTLEDAVPAPPVASENTWTIAIADASGAPLSGATVEVLPVMNHNGNNHGPASAIVVTDLGDGRYRLAPVDLFMVGLWTTTIRVTLGDMTDRVQFGFCVE